MPRLLLITATTGYQARAFETAASQLGVELVYATDRCKGLDDPWRDRAIPIRFHDGEKSVRAIVEAARAWPIDGVVALGDRPAVLGARIARALGQSWHPTFAAEAAASKFSKFSEQQELFEWEEIKRKKMLRAVTKIRDKFGYEALCLEV